MGITLDLSIINVTLDLVKWFFGLYYGIINPNKLIGWSKILLTVSNIFNGCWPEPNDGFIYAFSFILVVKQLLPGTTVLQQIGETLR